MQQGRLTIALDARCSIPLSAEVPPVGPHNLTKHAAACKAFPENLGLLAQQLNAAGSWCLRSLPVVEGVALEPGLQLLRGWWQVEARKELPNRPGPLGPINLDGEADGLHASMSLPIASIS